MGWFGKLIGGTIGFALGGPLGAVAGAAFGHAYDSSKLEPIHEDRIRLSTTENAQFTFFVATFSMLAKLAKADGQVSKEEIESIEKFMLYDLNLDPHSRKVGIDIFYTAMKSGETFEAFAGQFYQAFQTQPRLLEMMIDILIRVSIADGHLSENEDRLITSAVHTFRFSDERYRRIKTKYIQDNSRHYATLECKPSDTFETIKKQYRKLVSEYHPDKIASKGLPDEFMKFAHEKFREIQEAYEVIKKERGIR